jgi:hypothetical protein
MCELVFAVEAGRQAAVRALPEAEMLEDDAPARRPRARAVRATGPDPNKRAARAEWLPVSAGLRLASWGFLLVLAVAVAVVAVAASSSEMPRTGFAVCAVCAAGALALSALGRARAGRVPDGAPRGGAAGFAALVTWIAVLAALVCAGTVFEQPPLNRVWNGNELPKRTPAERVLPYAVLTLVLLALLSEVLFARFLWRVGRELRRAFPRGLAAVARWFTYLTFACALVALGGGIAGAVRERGEDPERCIADILDHKKKLAAADDQQHPGGGGPPPSAPPVAGPAPTPPGSAGGDGSSPVPSAPGGIFGESRVVERPSGGLVEPSAYILAGLAGLLAAGLGFISAILNAILYSEAARCVRAYARCEDE